MNLPRPEAAKFLAISVSTLRRWTKDGTVRAIRKGRIIRYDESDLQKCLDNLRGGNSEKPTAAPATRSASGTRNSSDKSNAEQARRTLAELRRGASLPNAQALADHKHASTTDRYVRASEKGIEKELKRQRRI